MTHMIERTRLRNGTRVLLIPRQDARSVIMRVGYKVGSRHEPLELAGASHFIEHMMFKGARRHKRAIDFSRALDRVGAVNNAETGEEDTGYFVRLHARHFALAVDVLSDMLLGSLFRPEDFESERKVIVEEARGYLEEPETLTEYLMHEAAYPDDALGRPIIGFLETIRAMDRRALLAYKAAHYVPANAVIAIAGRFDRAAVMDSLEHSFGKAPARKPPPIPWTLPVRREDGPRPRFARKPDAQQVTLGIAFDAFGRGHEDGPALAALVNVLGGTSSSRLFERVREKLGYSYNPRAGMAQFHGTGFLIVNAGLVKEKAGRAMGAIVDELLRLKTDGVSERELRDTKENIRGSCALQFESISACATDACDQELLSFTPMTIDQRVARIDAVTKADVLRVARQVIRASGTNLAVIAPKGDEKPYLKQLARLGE